METINDKINLERYLEYKDSEVEWLGEIPSHWELLTVKRLGKTKAGGTPSTTNLKFWDGNIPWLPSGKLQNCEINTAEKFITESGLKNSATKLIKPNTTMIALTGATCANIGYLKFEACANQSVIAIEEYENVNSKFLYYALINERNQILLSQTGGAQAGINETDVKNIIIPTPTYTEQTAIADFLDRKTALIDQAIDIKQNQIELLKERRQILIHKAVTRGLNPNVKMKDSGVEWIGEIPEGWEVKRLKDICYINLNSLPENTNNNFEFKYVDIGSVTIESGINNTEEYTFKNAPSRARRIAKIGDTVISTVRTYLKAIDFIDQVKSSYIYSTGFAILQPKEFIYPEFLGYFVRSDAFTEQVTVNSKGMSYPAINSTDIGRLTVVQCKAVEQKQIVEYIESNNAKIATAISLKEQEIEKLKEYKATLINSAVTGKIKVC